MSVKRINITLNKDTHKKLLEIKEQEHRNISNCIAHMIITYDSCRTCPFNHNMKEIKEKRHEIIRKILSETF